MLGVVSGSLMFSAEMKTIKRKEIGQSSERIQSFSSVPFMRPVAVYLLVAIMNKYKVVIHMHVLVIIKCSRVQIWRH